MLLFGYSKSTTKALRVLKRAESLLQNERPERAVALLTSFLSDHDDKDDVWRKLVRAYWMLGDELLAQAVLRHVVPRLPSPHMLEVIGAGLPCAKPLVIDEAKLIYYDVQNPVRAQLNAQYFMPLDFTFR